jgi:hypothetical protein
MPVVSVATIEHECERGVMFKTVIRDNQNRYAMFAIVRGIDEDGFHYNSLIFDGICSGCGRRFQYSILIEDLLEYREV